MREINPYAPPGSPSIVGRDPATENKRPRREPQSWTTPEVLGRAWSTYKADFGSFSGVMFVQIFAVTAARLGTRELAGMLIHDPSLKAVLQKVLPLVFGALVDALLAPGIVLLVLAALRKNEVRLDILLFKRMSLWPACFAVFVVARLHSLFDNAIVNLSIDTVLGFALELPVLFIVDANLGVIAAWRATGRIFMRAMGRITWLSTVCGVLAVVGLFACGLGYLVSGSIWYLALGMIYLRETGNDPAVGVALQEVLAAN